MKGERYYSSEYKEKYVLEQEVRRVSYVVEYLPVGEDYIKLGSIEHFLLLDREVLAAVVPLQGAFGADPTPHPTYGVTKLCAWPPAGNVTYVSVRNLKQRCVVVYLPGEQLEGASVAHITSYVHRVMASPGKWSSAFAL